VHLVGFTIEAKYLVCLSAFKRKLPVGVTFYSHRLNIITSSIKVSVCVKLQTFVSSSYKNGAVFGIDQLRYIYGFEKSL